MGIFRQKNKCAPVVCIFFLILCGRTVSIAQPETRSGLKLGIEAGEYLLAESGSFTKEPGLTVGFFTPIDLLTSPNSSVSLDLEFNFTRMVHYRTSHEVIAASFDQIRYRFLFDERFLVSFVEAGLLPTFLSSVSQKMAIGLYFGPSIGIGDENLVLHELSRTAVDTGWVGGEGPYSEYGKGLTTPRSLNIGVTCSYLSFIFDLRYKYTYVSKGSEVKILRNFYVQVGLAL
jgi:hypothetical protein